MKDFLDAARHLYLLGEQMSALDWLAIIGALAIYSRMKYGKRNLRKDEYINTVCPNCKKRWARR